MSRPPHFRPPGCRQQVGSPIDAGEVASIGDRTGQREVVELQPADQRREVRQQRICPILTPGCVVDRARHVVEGLDFTIKPNGQTLRRIDVNRLAGRRYADQDRHGQLVRIEAGVTIPPIGQVDRNPQFLTGPKRECRVELDLHHAQTYGQRHRQGIGQRATDYSGREADGIKTNRLVHMDVRRPRKACAHLPGVADDDAAAAQPQRINRQTHEYRIAHVHPDRIVAAPESDDLQAAAQKGFQGCPGQPDLFFGA